MGTIATKFSGDPAELLRAYEKIYAANVKMQQQMAAGAQQSRKQHGETLGHLQREVDSLKSLALGYLSIHKGLEMVGDAYAEQRRRIEDATKAQKELNRETLRQITLSGQAAHLTEIEKGLRNVPGATIAEAQSAWRGLQVGGEGLDWQRQLAIARAVAPAGGVGLQQPDLERAGQLAGELASFDTSSSPEMIAARAMQLATHRNADRIAGAKIAEPLRRLVGSGAVSVPQGLALAVEAASSQEAMGLPKVIADLVTNPYEKPKTKGRQKLTAEETAKMRFAVATSGERYRLLLQDAETQRWVAPAQAAQLAALNPARMQTEAQRFMTGEGATPDILSRMEADRGGRLKLDARRRALRSEQKDEGLALKGEAPERAREILDVEAKDKDSWTAFTDQLNYNVYRWINRTVSQPLGINSMSPETRALKAIEETNPGALQEFIKSTNYVEGARVFDDKGRYTAEGRQLLERQTRALENIDRQTKGLPNRSGVQVNNLNER